MCCVRAIHLVMASAVLCVCTLCGCQPSTSGTDNGASNNTGNTTGGGASGTWSATAGLTLSDGGATLSAGADAAPSNSNLTLRALTSDELVAGGLPAGQGFTSGVQLEPTGTTFAA